jgi:hypothetical protein
MLTLFTTAKPFSGHSDVIQRNALKSWKLLHPDIEVILFGDEKGAAEICQELGLRHEPNVERHESGFKYIGTIFDEAQKLARHDVLCYANCDILLCGDFVAAAQRVGAEKDAFLMFGRRWDTDIFKPIDFSNPEWAEEIRQTAFAANQQRDEWFIDYFVFRRGLFLHRIPKLVIGRVYWDNWLVWFAGHQGAALVDASAAVAAIHQNHDYGYHPQGKNGVWNDELARRNRELAGGYKSLRSMSSANYVLTSTGMKKRTILKRWSDSARDNWRNRVWHPILSRTRTIRHSLGLRRGSKRG